MKLLLLATWAVAKSWGFGNFDFDCEESWETNWDLQQDVIRDECEQLCRNVILYCDRTAMEFEAHRYWTSRCEHHFTPIIHSPCDTEGWFIALIVSLVSFLVVGGVALTVFVICYRESRQAQKRREQQERTRPDGGTTTIIYTTAPPPPEGVGYYYPPPQSYPGTTQTYYVSSPSSKPVH